MAVKWLKSKEGALCAREPAEKAAGLCGHESQTSEEDFGYKKVPQGTKEAHLCESPGLPQGVQAHVQAGDPHGQDGPEGWQLLRAS